MPPVISNEQKAELKGMLPEYLGAVHGINNVHRNFSCLNPDHEDRHPSMAYNPRTKKVGCYSCGFKADIFDLAGADFGVNTFPEKVEAAANAVGYRLDNADLQTPPGKPPLRRPVGPAVPEESDIPEGADITEGAVWAFDALYDSPDASAAREDLLLRGFTGGDVGRFGFGWVRHPNDLMPGRFNSAPNTTGGYIALTFFKADPGPDLAADYCVFRPVGERCDGTGTAGLKKEYKPAGLKSRLWNAELLESGGTVYVTEGIYDAASLNVMFGVDAVALCGTGNVALLARTMEAIEPGRRARIVLCMDNDEAGTAAAAKAAELLGAAGVTYKVADLMPEGFKDPNEWLAAERPWTSRVNEGQWVLSDECIERLSAEATGGPRSDDATEAGESDTPRGTGPSELERVDKYGRIDYPPIPIREDPPDEVYNGMAAWFTNDAFGGGDGAFE